MENTIVCSASSWDADTIERFMTDSVIPIRLSCLTSQGEPHVMSLWFAYVGGEILVSVQEDAWMARWLTANPRCGFEIAGDQRPYCGVRGRGRAKVVAAADRPILPQLIERYLGDDDQKLAQWLLSRTDTEVTIGIQPNWLTSWDYGSRMSAS